MIDDDEHNGYSKHVTCLDIDKPGLWPCERPTTRGHWRKAVWSRAWRADIEIVPEQPRVRPPAGDASTGPRDQPFSWSRSSAQPSSSWWRFSLLRGLLLVTWGERAAWLDTRAVSKGVDGGVNSSSTAPIKPAALTIPVPSAVHDSGADTAPCAIGIESCTTLGTTLVVHLSGEVDHYSASPLRALLASAADAGYTGLVLDTARVTFCDSALLAALTWWPRRGRRLRLANRSRAVTHLLNAAGVTGLHALHRHTPRAGVTA
ncbi:STAS domain-containing protein [Streptomyces sp. NPDC002825]|uniref:STAS domain-containing protein n=1 Tax=Streptomyces sp. NPDC002825 TaxID=3154666 RepID=UPI003323AFE5